MILANLIDVLQHWNKWFFIYTMFHFKIHWRSLAKDLYLCLDRPYNLIMLYTGTSEYVCLFYQFCMCIAIDLNSYIHDSSDECKQMTFEPWTYLKDHDSVLHRQLIARQPLAFPCQLLALCAEEAPHVKALQSAELAPLCQLLLAFILRRCGQVGDEPGSALGFLG